MDLGVMAVQMIISAMIENSSKSIHATATTTTAPTAATTTNRQITVDGLNNGYHFFRVLSSRFETAIVSLHFCCCCCCSPFDHYCVIIRIHCVQHIEMIRTVFISHCAWFCCCLQRISTQHSYGHACKLQVNLLLNHSSSNSGRAIMLVAVSR